MNDTLATLTAGSFSGAVADLVTHPISTVKTRLQVQGASASLGSSSLVSYSGPFSAFRVIVATEGVGSLYTGIGAVLAAAAPAQALYFVGYEAARSVLPAHPLADFTAGVAAQLCGSIAWVPMDVIKERLQIEAQVKNELTETYGGSFNALRQIIKGEGVIGLYRAYWIHQATWCPFNGLYFAIYESTKNFMSKRDLPLWPAGIVAGVVASAATNPMDLVKTRLQVARSNPKIFDYEGSIDCAVKIIKREGPLALFDGVLSRILLLTPRLTIAVTAYETTRQILIAK